MTFNHFMDDAEEARAQRLFSALGVSSLQLIMPMRGWGSEISIHFNVSKDDGRFLFRSSGDVDYLCRKRQIIGWRQAPRSLIDTAIRQLEKKAQTKLLNSVLICNMPYIEYLVLKYYDLI